MQKLVISLGDPAGVGAEITLRALADLVDSTARIDAYFLLIGERQIIERARKITKFQPTIHQITSPEKWNYPLAFYEPQKWHGALPRFGKWTKQTGAISFTWAKIAAELCKNKVCDAMITAPICKAAWHAAEKKYPGHTELLGKICGKRKELMMLVGEKLRVALVTIHEPLARVPRLITIEKIIHAGILLNHELSARFAITHPRIGILGLNPHSGEQGEIGNEEIKVIIPAIKKLRQRRINVAAAPLPADVAFHQMRRGDYDVLLAMYHDQGLAALKTVAFDCGVNITLGLPIIRTSPDHGTAFDLAGKGSANHQSMLAAIQTALTMGKH